MSVAFRRDSDEEHLEPKFELPIPPGPNHVTPRGYRLIEVRAAELEALLAETVGDEARKPVLRDLRYWRQRLASAQIAPIPDGGEVAIGTRVTFVQQGQSRTLAIVGHDESDPAGGRVAFSAPLPRALLGAVVGDEFDLPGPAGSATVTAIAVVADDAEAAD